MTGPSTDLTCPVCGTVNPAARQFCRKCAADLRAPAPGSAAPLQPAGAVPMRRMLIGIAIALGVIALLLGALFMLTGSPAASPTPEPSPSPVATLVPSAGPTIIPPTAAPTNEPTIIPPPPTPTEPPPSVGSGDPVVDTLTGPGRASCTGTNGTGTPGYIHLEWTASNTTGVRLSIDPPAPNVAYDYGYDDYPADGEADVPFTCDPPNSDSNGAYHLYVATTIHDGGRFAWRFIRVYLRD